MRFRLLLAAVAAVHGALAPIPVRAQSLSDSTSRSRRLFARSDLYVLGAFSAVTVAMFPLDEQLASLIRDSTLVANHNLHRLSGGIRFFGGPGPYLIGGGMYVVGRLAHIPRATELAVHGTEAVMVGSAASAAIKVLLGRARPYVSSDTNPRDFRFGRGLQGADAQSFPSGHTTAAFAAAAAVSAETAAWWPRTRWLIGPILYGGASLVALSRMYDDKHWASDVVMGAAVGTFAGLKTVRFTHTRAGNRVDRWLLGTDDGGTSVRLSGFFTGSGAGMAANMSW